MLKWRQIYWQQDKKQQKNKYFQKINTNKVFFL